MSKKPVGFAKHKNGKAYPIHAPVKGKQSTSHYTPRRRARKRAKSLSLEQRMERQWKAGHSGDTDMSFTHKKRAESPFPEYEPIVSNRDVYSLDHPKSNLPSFKGPTDRKIYVGGGNKTQRKRLLAVSKSSVNNNFTKEEVMEMGPMLIRKKEPKGLRSWAGCCTHKRSSRHPQHKTGRMITPHIIDISGRWIDDKSVMVHELEHARRYNMGFRRDSDREEKETELATMARLDSLNQLGSDCGYYQYIPEVKQLLNKRKDSEAKALMKKYRTEDRELMLGRKTGPGIKGKTLDRKLRENYNKSHISRAHFSPAERLDNYYYIETKDGEKLELHIRTHPKLGENPPPVKEIRKGVKKEHPGAKVYEIQDGKRVRV